MELSFSPVAGILLVEREEVSKAKALTESFQSRCRDFIS